MYFQSCYCFCFKLELFGKIHKEAVEANKSLWLILLGDLE